MQRNAIASFLPLCLAVAAIAAPGISQDEPKPAPKHMVRFSFKEGSVRHSLLTMDVTSKMTGGNEDTETVMKTMMWFTTTVKSTKGSVAQLEQVVTRVKATMDGPSGKVDYDSDDKNSDPGAMVYTVKNLVGQKVRFKLDDTGKQSDVKLPQTDLQTIRNIRGWHQTVLQGLSPLPSYPIAIHDKWRVSGKSTAPLISPMELVLTTETELLQVDKTSVTVKQKQTVNEDQELPGALNAKDIEIGGTYKLDLRTGMPVEATMITRMKTKGLITADMAIKQTIKPAPPPKAKAQDKPAKTPGK